MAYIGNNTDHNAEVFKTTKDRFSGNASTTAFTLSAVPANAESMQVFVNNVRQDSGQAYTVSGTTLTFTSAPSNATGNIYVVFNSVIAGIHQVITANTQLRTSVVTQHAMSNTATYSVGELLVGGTILLDNTGDVGIKHVAPLVSLHVQDSALSGSDTWTADVQAVFGRNGNAGLAIYGAAANAATIKFAKPTDYDVGRISYNFATDVLNFSLAATSSWAMTSESLYGLNAAGPALMQEAATSTNPTIIPNKADLDTGIGWVSADIGSLVAGGTEALRWDASGIEVYRNATNTHARIKINNPHASAYSSELSLVTNSRSWLVGAGDNAIGVDNAGDFHIYDATAAAYRMVIKSTGNIGIGTTAPSTTLQVSGTVTATAFAGPLTGNVTGNASGTAATVTTAAQPAITSLGTLSALTIQAPSWSANCLTLKSSTSASGDYAGIQFNNAGTNTADIYTDETGNWSVTTNANIYLKTGSQGISGGTARLTVLAAGNVGIGTTSPSAELHVVGDLAGVNNAMLSVSRNSTRNLDTGYNLSRMGSVNWVDGGGTVSGTLPSASHSVYDTGTYIT